MNIQNISKEERKVIVELDADDLILICNAMYHQLDEECKESFLSLYSDMILARDLCQYGHIDDFSLHSIVKYRNSIGTGLDGVLSDKDIDTFNSYIESNNGVMSIAFKNSDWNSIYKKIVGRHGILRSSKIKNWIKEKDEK